MVDNLKTTYTSPAHLDISIVDFIDLKNKRIDAEYYRKYFFDIEDNIKNKKHFSLKDISKNKTKRFRKGKDFEYLEIANINLTDGDYFYSKIKKEETPSRAQKILQEKDVVISTVRPNRNAVAFILDKDFKILKVASSGFCVLRDFKDDILSDYIFVLFKTNIFRDLLDRETTATMYPAVSEDDILNLRIPIPSKPFQEKIAEVVHLAHKKREESKKLYAEAENVLLRELGLKDWKPTEKNTAIKEIEEAKLFGRMDAEFFQPKYDEIDEKIKKHEHSLLGEVVIFKKGRQRIDAHNTRGVEDTAYCSIKDIDDFEIIADQFVSRSSLAKNLRANKNDLLLAITGATIGKVGINLKEEELAFSGDLLRISPKSINPLFLSVFLRSPIGQEAVLRYPTGTTNRHLAENDVSQIPIPRLNKKEEKIAEKIKASHLAREESKSLLEKAKKAVEVFMEKDEKAGEKILN